MKVSQSALREVQEALKDYEREVQDSPNLGSETKRTYLRHAKTFVRWLDDDFAPGEGSNGRR